MKKSAKMLRFLNKAEKSVKKLDATDILIVALAGFAFGSVISALSKKFMKKISPLLAIVGGISSIFIIVKLFFSDDKEVPFVKVRR